MKTRESGMPPECCWKSFSNPEAILRNLRLDRAQVMRHGFTGPAYATHGTRDLCAALLPDAGHIQEFEVEVLNRRNRRHGVAAVTPI